MRPLRYSINVTLDGCVAHDAASTDDELHNFHERNLEQADALLSGRIIYQMMESAWREPGESGVLPDWMEPWMMPFAKTIHEKKKYVVSTTLDHVDWNAELVRGDLRTAVVQLKQQPGTGIQLGGVTLPLALAKLGLIDEYEFVVHPTIAGRGPRLLDGLAPHVDLQLVSHHRFSGGAMALRYVPVGPMPEPGHGAADAHR